MNWRSTQSAGSSSSLEKRKSVTNNCFSLKSLVARAKTTFESQHREKEKIDKEEREFMKLGEERVEEKKYKANQRRLPTQQQMHQNFQERPRKRPKHTAINRYYKVHPSHSHHGVPILDKFEHSSSSPRSSQRNNKSPIQSNNKEGTIEESTNQRRENKVVRFADSNGGENSGSCATVSQTALTGILKPGNQNWNRITASDTGVNRLPLVSQESTKGILPIICNSSTLVPVLESCKDDNEDDRHSRFTPIDWNTPISNWRDPQNQPEPVASASALALASATTPTTTNTATTSDAVAAAATTALLRLQEQVRSKTRDHKELQHNFIAIEMQNVQLTNTIEEQQEEIRRLREQLDGAMGGPSLPVKIEDVSNELTIIY